MLQTEPEMFLATPLRTADAAAIAQMGKLKPEAPASVPVTIPRQRRRLGIRLDTRKRTASSSR